ncbi:MAG: heme-binding beta-barrel domain-containing protein [Candidatus Devosia phytovorans]|uniref:Heme-binding beta-barrel domain-containing protein n=1 Tax=Candidatus Devosia phytovorans TaxID=3121372 RepID=A0AAJ5VWJ7_9HYPH|nr:heme-binding beta-barrel domain-containing protein [Devosia sp.]WEK04802.1 MAG: heme-binding beta-barrel domain-containing protein [Devosia sp.]
MRSKFFAGFCTLVMALPMMVITPVTTQAAEEELALLGSYVGSWRGEGALVGGDKPEPFRCRLSVAKGNQGKINYSGRCTLVSATLSISGTIAYNDQARQYEAAMSSNAGFTGLAIGQQSSGQISFDLRERQKDRTGSDVRIGSKILLEGNDSITVNFEVEFNDSGEVLTASVPFSQ